MDFCWEKSDLSGSIRLILIGHTVTRPGKHTKKLMGKSWKITMLLMGKLTINGHFQWQTVSNSLFLWPLNCKSLPGRVQGNPPG